MPHSYQEGTDIHPHIHYSASIGSSITYYSYIGLEYTWVNLGDSFPSSTTLLNTQILMPTSSMTHALGEIGIISGTGKKISSILVCRLYRNGTNALDTYPFDIYIYEIDFHFMQQGIGSTQEYIK